MENQKKSISRILYHKSPKKVKNCRNSRTIRALKKQFEKLSRCFTFLYLKINVTKKGSPLIHKRLENKLCFYIMENWVGRGAKIVSFWVIKLLRMPEGAFDRVQ